LFRGDGDYRKERDLRNLLSRDLIKTNLVNGGIGREIFELPLIENIRNHVNDKWKKTHFLSFSEDFERAVTFGKGKGNENREYENYYEDDDKWDFIILSIAIEKFLDVKEISPGVYQTYFIPSFNVFQPRYYLLVIDVNTVLSASPIIDSHYAAALANARRDKEWLIFPAHLKDFGNRIEFSGLLDCALFSEISKYVFI